MAFFYQAAEQQRFRITQKQLDDFMTKFEQIQNEILRKYDIRTAAILAKTQERQDKISNQLFSDA
jgi:hypothetical protein